MINVRQTTATNTCKICGLTTVCVSGSMQGFPWYVVHICKKCWEAVNSQVQEAFGRRA